MRARRKELGITRDDAAASFRAATGRRTNPTAIDRWEDFGYFTAPELLVIAEILDVSPCWILTGQK